MKIDLQHGLRTRRPTANAKREVSETSGGENDKGKKNKKEKEKRSEFSLVIHCKQCQESNI